MSLINDALKNLDDRAGQPPLLSGQPDVPIVEGRKNSAETYWKFAFFFCLGVCLILVWAWNKETLFDSGVSSSSDVVAESVSSMAVTKLEHTRVSASSLENEEA